ncbi:phosphatidylinositol transfer protein alpha isoform isoform X1 [Rhopalosiphum maidis]|uniref:phosphatidylinositol transfer protein alpha isoform isoform X1 n=1 Tax=Rhopalosiphum maidis TaxID=43146 RepID=UPI000EFE4790|nr:phosphatidylinositol transfer protein alpha isoform isoform X1 [Rhopalosiphum maidis]
MLIKEFRVVLPLTVEEYQIAQLYSVAEASKNETGGGEGIEVLKNEPFTNYPLLGGKYSEGQYTYKIYHLASKVPGMIKLLAPKGALEVHEEAWNAYPYCRTVITNPNYMKEKFMITIESFHYADRGTQNNNPNYMKENFSIVIESYHIADRGTQENVHELSPEKLKQREVQIIDIGNDSISSSDYKEDEDPKKFKSQKSGRGPLQGNWIETANPVMTCYKLVSADFKWFGLQNRVENLIQKSERRLFTNFHRQVFCWMDRWHGLTLQDIREIEEKTREVLDRQRNEGTVRGMKADAD